MNTAAIKKTEIIKRLSRVSEKDLDRIKMCIDSVIKDAPEIVQKQKSLKGIWKGKDIAELENIESAVKLARKQLGDSILKREL